VPLLQALYPRNSVSNVGNGLRAFQVSPAALAATQGVMAIGPDGSKTGVSRFGAIPSEVALPARLRWQAGIRLPRAGNYRLAVSASGHVELQMDGIALLDAPSGAEAEVLAAPGLHFLELVADVAGRDQSIRLALTGPDGAVRQLPRNETYRLMDAPWGLLGRFEKPRRGQPTDGPAAAFLDSTIAMAFFDPEFGSVPVPNTLTWTGSLIAPRTGVYRMAFAADDAVRLEIDGQPSNVTWLRPADWRRVGRGTEVRLNQGPHTVKITLDVTHEGRELTRWNWVPPTSSGAVDNNEEWSVVPPSVLRPDPPVSVVRGGRR
jgi:hypothetical protein